MHKAEEKLIEMIGVDLEIKQAKIGDYIINYAVSGKGRPLLLIHGANLGWGQWYLNIGKLSKYFKVYAIDLPGAGNSTKIDFLKSDLQKDFVDIVDKFIELEALDNVIIVGHSFGGWITLKLFLKSNVPISKMVLVNPMGFTNYVPLHQKLVTMGFIAKILSSTVMKPTEKNIETFLKRALINCSTLKQEFSNYVFESIKQDKKSHPFLFINRLTNLFRIKKEILFKIEDLYKISLPTLVIVGDKDVMTPISKCFALFNLLPLSRVEIFSDIGHAPFLEDSERFNNLLIDFNQ